MSFDQLIADYVAGSDQLRKAVAGMSDAQLDAQPVAGKWSTREVICHIADFEPVYADRMKRVIAEDKPALMSGDPDLFKGKLAYANRPIQDELDLIAVVRRQMAVVLRSIKAEDFQRTGIHSSDGPLTLETLLKRITNPFRIMSSSLKRSARRWVCSQRSKRSTVFRPVAGRRS